MDKSGLNPAREGAGSEKGDGVLLYGGSFNPIHIGHIRLALEAREKLRHLLDEIVFMPAYWPPHKDPRGLLPFSLRAGMIRKSVARYPFMRCSELEGERGGPSYTIDTVRLFREKNPDRAVYFLIGSQDFLLLPEWRDGLELLVLVNLVVAPRGDFSFADLDAATRAMRPDVRAREAALAAGEGGPIYFPVHFLDISSSMIREKWLRNENIDYLTPARVVASL
ncbi:MAG: nicotinate (nicotinamide) nucleotide adenylyltransferase, partial [Desulfovibrio sp.]|nr:nicotinate (nicotinamide) nucleotide adenylyltransferase [Desulfovibrio sp.]